MVPPKKVVTGSESGEESPTQQVRETAIELPKAPPDEDPIISISEAIEHLTKVDCQLRRFERKSSVRNKISLRVKYAIRKQQLPLVDGKIKYYEFLHWARNTEDRWDKAFGARGRIFIENAKGGASVGGDSEGSFFPARLETCLEALHDAHARIKALQDEISAKDETLNRQQKLIDKYERRIEVGRASAKKRRNT